MIFELGIRRQDFDEALLDGLQELEYGGRTYEKAALEDHCFSIVAVVWRHLRWWWAKERVVGYQHFVPS